MTPEEKVAALVEYIEKNFPRGCRDVLDCKECPLNSSESCTIEDSICSLLSDIDGGIA